MRERRAKMYLRLRLRTVIGAFAGRQISRFPSYTAVIIAFLPFIVSRDNKIVECLVESFRH